jgi:thiosulfate/3-mercaptopyruvate sulfurtransferase
MRTTVVLAALVLVPLTPALAQSPAPGGGMLIGVQDLAAQLKSPDLVLLHVAERASFFEDGHIPGARFLRYADFAVDGPDDLGSELPPADDIRRIFEAVGVSDTSRVVLYAQNPVVAARAFFTLDAFGHARVAILDGGLRAWRAANQPVETGTAPPPRTGRFTPRLNAQRLVTAAWIQQQVPGTGYSLVDVRPDPEFTGSDGGMGGVHAAGHIAGARQLTWNALVGPDGRFLPPDQLKARLEGAGVVAGRPIVAYCMVGMRASVVYFVARHLGYDARLYDGSIVDWSRRQLPVRAGKQ